MAKRRGRGGGHKPKNPMLGSPNTAVPVGAVLKKAPPDFDPRPGPDDDDDLGFPEIIAEGTFVDSFFWTVIEASQEDEEEGTRWNLRCRVYQGEGEGGVLKAWINKDSFDTPDPDEEPDGTFEIEAESPYVEQTIQPETVFDLTEGGTDALLSGILSGATTTKYIYLEFETSEGNSSGVIEVRVPSFLGGLDWNGRINPGVPTSEGTLIPTLRDRFEDLLEAIGLTEAGWNKLVGVTPEGQLTSDALSDKIIGNHEIAERVFEYKVFNEDFLDDEILNSESNTRLFEEGSVPDSLLADFIFGNTAVIDRLFANNVFSQSVMTRLLTAGAIVAEKITATTLESISAVLGEIVSGILRSADSRFHIHLDLKILTILDNTGQTRVQIGHFGIDPDNPEHWGIRLLNSLGQTIFTTEAGITEDGIPDSIITAPMIRAGEVNADHVWINGDLNVIGISDLGFITSGFLEGTNGAIRLNSSYSGTENGGDPIQSRNAFIDFAATGSELFMRHPLMELGINQTEVEGISLLPAPKMFPKATPSGAGDEGPWRYNDNGTIIYGTASGRDTILFGVFEIPPSSLLTSLGVIVHRSASGATVEVEITSIEWDVRFLFSGDPWWEPTINHTTGVKEYSTTFGGLNLSPGQQVQVKVTLRAASGDDESAGFVSAWAGWEASDLINNTPTSSLPSV